MIIRENDHHHEQEIRRPAISDSWEYMNAASPVENFHRPRGSNIRWDARCPECGKRSFSMYDDTGEYHCHTKGCDTHGDKLDYIALVAGCSRSEALALAHERFSMMEKRLLPRKKREPKREQRITENDLIISELVREPDILNNCGVTRAGQDVLLALLHLADGREIAIISYDEIAPYAHCSKSTVSRAVRNLRDAKLIATKRLSTPSLKRGGKRRDVYQFTINLSYLRSQQLQEWRIN